VPITRYFVFVGGVLVALLFAAGWIWPISGPAVSQDTTAQAAADAPVARIHSTQKWPDKIEFDTSKPNFAPPPVPVVAATAPAAQVVAENTPAASPLDARAEIKPNVQVASAQAPRRQARVHHRYSRQAPARWANAYPAAPSWGGWNW
jgi:hypothetical protein